MSVIAWDGKTLAADKRTTYATSIATTTKIERMPDGALVGCAGNASLSMAVRAWFRDGRHPEKFPQAQREASTNVDVLCIEPDGRVHVYQLSPFPVVVEDKWMSFGCGSNYALAAMYLGKTAAEAVAVAIALDSGCGNGIDALTFEGDA